MQRQLLALGMLLLLPFTLIACGSDTEPGSIHVVRADGPIDPIMERYLSRAIGNAEDDQAALVLIEMDTPGGLSESMRKIVQRIERSEVPIAVYVAPNGARAASAGTFITYAAHIAAMAPNTSIGAASAINSDGSDIEGTLGDKIENDAVALIRGTAELRGRNADWAESAVRDAIAATSTQALELNVIDYLATDRADLLRQVEGSEIRLDNGRTVTMTGLPAADQVDVNMTPWEHVLSFLANPTVASLLLTIAFIGIVTELSSPGLIFPGAIGVVALFLGFLGFDILPVNTIGIILILVGVAMLILELFVPGGIVGIGGLLVMGFGVFTAFRDTPEFYRPPEWIGALLAFVIVGMFVTLTVSTIRIARMSAEMGTRSLIGKSAIARTEIAPSGYVFVQGERWKAETSGGVIPVGARVKIVGAEGFTLRVRNEES